MLTLFKPESKVQKDRKIMRETDARMAKYSRRGLVLSFAAFLACMLLGDFLNRQPTLAIVLAAGLLLITLWRGYYLFRFDAIYSCAPARWRNRYFIASFIGAGWWSCIIVSLTLELGMSSETPIMWLFTVVFFSSVANVFAPYRRFLSLYLFIGQIPVAISAVTLGNLEGYLYGVMMLVFFLSLNHQGQVTAKTYWDKLEANQSLKKKAKDLEEENLGSQAAINLKNEFLTNLGHEFRTSLNDVLGALSLLENSEMTDKQRELLTLAEKASERQLGLVSNVMDYSRIASNELVLNVSTFNLRRHLESLIEDVAAEAHQQGVEFNYIFDPEMPTRVKGDAIRLGEILTNLVSHAIKFSEQGDVLLEANFKRESEGQGQLQVIVSDQGRGGGLADQQELLNPYAKVKTTKAGTGLGLAICKGLAECMGGTVSICSETGEGSKLSLNIQLETPGKQPLHLNSNPKLHGRRILLVNPPSKIIDSLMLELKNWGMALEVVPDEDKAMQRLDAAAGSEHPFDIVLIYAKLQNLNALSFSSRLCREGSLASLKQVLAISQLQQSGDEVRQHLKTYSQVSVIDKPIIRQHLHDAIAQQLLDIKAGTVEKHAAKVNEAQGLGHRILLVEDHRVNQMVAMGMLKKLGYSVILAGNGREAIDTLESENFDLVLMDCQMPEMDGYMATREIRNRENNKGDDSHIPIIAMTAHAAEGDQSRCLASGMDDYLAKPVRYEELETRLRRWLGAGDLQAENS